MADTNSGGATPPVQAAPQTPAPAPDSSLKEQDFSKRVQEAKGPQAVRELLNEAKRLSAERAQEKAKTTAAAKPADDIPPDLKAAAEAEAKAATEATPEETPAATEEEAAAEPEAQPETPAEEATEAEEGEQEDGGDGPIQPVRAKRIRMQLPQGDEVGRLTAALLQRNRDWTMEEALSAARKQLGIKDPGAKKDEAAAPKSDLPETVEAADAMIEQLEAAHEEAMKNVELDKVATLARQLRKLDRHRSTLERDAQQKQVTARAEFDRKFDASESKAAELYAFASDPESPGGKRMREIERELKANDDPLYYSADKPLKIAQMVAAELNIAPRRKGAPQAPAKAAVPATAAPKKPTQVIPSGASRTTPPATAQKPAIDAEVSSVKTLADLRKLQKSLGLPI